MCGRFTQYLSWREIHELYSLTGAAALNVQPRYNGAPTQDFVACRLDATGNRGAAKLRWGLVPPWAKDVKIGARMINARAETVHEKSAFRSAFRARRCLVPVNGWFEWQRTADGKQPYLLGLEDGSPMSFSGLWERWDKGGETVQSFTIITTEAAPALATIHHRQPAIISGDAVATWLDPASARDILLDLVREPHLGPYEVRAVNARVNSVRNDDPAILERLTVSAAG